MAQDDTTLVRRKCPGGEKMEAGLAAQLTETSVIETITSHETHQTVKTAV